MSASWAFLAVTLALVAALAAIALRTYRKGGAEAGERAKYRMLDDD